MAQTTWRKGDRVVNQRTGKEGKVHEVRANIFNESDILVSIAVGDILTVTSQAAHEYQGWQIK